VALDTLGSMSDASAKSSAGPEVVLYSQPGCAPCFAARRFLIGRGVAFEYKDVQADPQAFRELMDLGSRSTPTLRVGKEVMIGFDPEKLAELLAKEAGAPRE
jgi:glutaredoxin